MRNLDREASSEATTVASEAGRRLTTDINNSVNSLANWSRTPTRVIGTERDDYEYLSELGQGGMAVVQLARQTVIVVPSPSSAWNNESRMSVGAYLSLKP